MREEVVVGMFFLNECPIIILFDSGPSHDFISQSYHMWPQGCHT
jgi:hypothetical protein